MGKTFEFGAAEKIPEVSRNYNDALIAKIIVNTNLTICGKIMDILPIIY
jgi:hypothetical protein